MDQVSSVAESNARNNADNSDYADDEEPEDGIPWYLALEKQDPVLGMKTDAKDFHKIKFSEPPPCTEELVCLLVRRATLNTEMRTKKISIELLCGEPALFLNPVSNSPKLQKNCSDEAFTIQAKTRKLEKSAFKRTF